MTPLRPAATAAALCFALSAVAGAARAETHHTCAGFIDVLPATIATPGIWCLRQDVGTAIASGAAITVAANNVLIDCNGFRIGGLAAGLGTATSGIRATNRTNTTVRNCNVRGFLYGVELGGSGHVVEDNRFDGSTYYGVYVDGDGSVIRRNQVLDTGGSTVLQGAAGGIYTHASVDVIDNTIDGVAPTIFSSGGTPYGIYTDANTGGTVVGNRIRGLVAKGDGSPIGIYNYNPATLSISDNAVSGASILDSIGIYCTPGTAVAHGNFIMGFALPVAGCTSVGNVP